MIYSTGVRVHYVYSELNRRGLNDPWKIDRWQKRRRPRARASRYMILCVYLLGVKTRSSKFCISAPFYSPSSGCPFNTLHISIVHWFTLVCTCTFVCACVRVCVSLALYNTSRRYIVQVNQKTNALRKTFFFFKQYYILLCLVYRS